MWGKHRHAHLSTGIQSHWSGQGRKNLHLFKTFFFKENLSHTGQSFLSLGAWSGKQYLDPPAVWHIIYKHPHFLYIFKATLQVSAELEGRCSKTYTCHRSSELPSFLHSPEPLESSEKRSRSGKGANPANYTRVKPLEHNPFVPLVWKPHLTPQQGLS